MPVHEKQATYANTKSKRGLNGRAGGRVEAAGTAPQPEYALGDISPAQTATTTPLAAGRPAIVASSPAVGTVRVTITLDPAIVDYGIYVDGTLRGARETTAGPHDRTGITAGARAVTVRGRDEDGNEFTVSATSTVTVA